LRMPRSRLANFGGLSQFRPRSWRDGPRAIRVRPKT
jgi:hypothetical protein